MRRRCSLRLDCSSESNTMPDRRAWSGLNQIFRVGIRCSLVLFVGTPQRQIDAQDFVMVTSLHFLVRFGKLVERPVWGEYHLHPRYSSDYPSRCQNFAAHFVHILTRVSPCLYGTEALSDGCPLYR